MTPAEPILHHYPRSPSAEKARLALGLKGAAYGSVLIPSWAPKPDLVALTGGYRRTPVLQVGADVYCDTLAILRRIERLPSARSLFPGGAEAQATALGWGLEKALFVPAIGLVVGLTGHTYPRALIDDRLLFFGFSLEQADMLPRQALFAGRLNAHLAWLAGLMADGRPYLLGAEPSAADLAAYHPLWHLRRAGGDAAAAEAVPELVPGLAPVLPWMDRVAAIGHGTPRDVSAADALAAAAASVPAPLATDPGAARLLGLDLGSEVNVTPDDTGRDPVRGRLVGLTAHDIVVARRGASLGEVHVHFPRVGFDIEPA